MSLITRLWKEESGQGMVEYGLILALVAVVAMAGLLTLGPKIKEIFGAVENELVTTP